MKNIKNSADLDSYIEEKSRECNKKSRQLQITVSVLVNSLKPINLLKQSVRNVLDEENLMEKISTGLLGLGAGYISKKILVGNSESKIRQLLGALLQTEVSASIMSEASLIKIAVPKIKDWIINRLAKRASK